MNEVEKANIQAAGILWHAVNAKDCQAQQQPQKIQSLIIVQLSWS